MDLKVSSDAGGDMAVGTQGLSADDLTEVSMKVGLLGDPLPGQLQNMGILVESGDLLAELDGMGVPEASVQSLARLLITEHLLGSRGARARLRDSRSG